MRPGTTLANFRVLSRLGARMGEDYRAEDSKPGRRVAIKIIPGGATIYEIGEPAGVLFIAMEYVEGVPLSNRVGTHPLKTSEIRLARQAAT